MKKALPIFVSVLMLAPLFGAVQAQDQPDQLNLMPEEKPQKSEQLNLMPEDHPNLLPGDDGVLEEEAPKPREAFDLPRYIKPLDDRPGDVRGYIWGVNREDIMDNEKGMYFDAQEEAAQGDILYFLDYVNGMKSLIGYELYKDQLWRVHINFEKRYVEPHLMLEDLGEIQLQLEKQYGPPIQEDFIWIDDKDKNYPQGWGWSVMQGKLQVVVRWKTPKSEIELSLKGRNFKKDFSLTYTSRVFKEEIEGQPIETLLP